MADGAAIPLVVLVIDSDSAAAEVLANTVSGDRRVIQVATSGSISDARGALSAGNFNAVFIDPISLGVDATSQFVFSIRVEMPEITFVLYMDLAEADRTPEFYSGERRRFRHYFVLDKRTPVAAFEDELRAVLSQCISDLRYLLSEETLKRLTAAADEVAEHSSLPSDQIAELKADIEALRQQILPAARDGRTVFLSHRFADTEYVDGLRKLLENAGFEVLIGAPTNTYVSQAILQRIKDADHFVCLMTCDKEKTDGTFTTSPWLLEEKGAALAYGKRIVLMVEHGIDDYGGLQGDWQRIHFGPKGFTTAALQAIDQLKSYVE